MLDQNNLRSRYIIHYFETEQIQRVNIISIVQMVISQITKTAIMTIQACNYFSYIKNFKEYYCSCQNVQIIRMFYKQFKKFKMLRANSERQVSFNNKIVTKITNNIKTSDLLNLGFCKPFQIALKTSDINHNGTNDSLPEGLMLVVKKEGVSDNKYDLQPILPIPIHFDQHQQLEQNHMNNYLSLLKSKVQSSREKDQKEQMLSKFQQQIMKTSNKKSSGKILQKQNQTNDWKILKQNSQQGNKNYLWNHQKKIQDKFQQYYGLEDVVLEERQESQEYEFRLLQRMQSRQSSLSIKLQQSQVNTEESKKTEIGICITMSGEDKQSLKKTLLGVVENVDKMIKFGISPDDIFVVVIIDGMANVDKSIYDYLQQFQLESNSFFEQGTQPNLEQMYRQINRCQYSEQRIPSLTHYFFNNKQVKNRLDLRPKSVISAYKDNLCKKKQIQKILEQIKVNNVFQQSSTLSQNNQLDSLHISKKMTQLSRQNDLYFSTRQKLAYVSAYKLQTRSFSSKIKKYQAQQIDQIIEKDKQDDPERFIYQILVRNMQKRKKLITIKEQSKPSFNTIRYVNLFFCIKYQQSGKLSSHNWFLNGFCKELKPKYSVIIDAGVCPGSDAIFNMYRCLKKQKNVGGVCSYVKLKRKTIITRKELNDIDCLSRFLSCFFDLSKVQRIQNHFENLVERPFEHVCGFAYSLPVSFSAYRMEALRQSDQKDNLLKDYFKQVNQKVETGIIVQSQLTLKQILMRFFLPRLIWRHFITIDEDSQETLLNNQNINQSQDHILCLGIQKSGKKIKFMPDSQVEKDCQENIHDLMNLKKKEINGREQSLQKVRRQLPNNNFFVRVMQGYLQFSRSFQYFSLSIFFIMISFSFMIVKTQMMSWNPKQSISYEGAFIFISFASQCLAIFLLGGVILLSLVLNYKHPKFKFYTTLISTILGIISLVSITVIFIEAINLFISNEEYLKRKKDALKPFSEQMSELYIRIYQLGLLANISIISAPYLFYSIIFLKFDRVVDLMKGILSCIFYLPTTSIIIPMYAKCRYDDISLIKNIQKNKKLKQSWRNIKTILVYKYLFWNIFACTIYVLIQDYRVKFTIVISVLLLFGFFNFLKVFAALLYLIIYKCSKLLSPHKPAPRQIHDDSIQNGCQIYQILKRFSGDFLVNMNLQLQMNIAKPRQNQSQ